MENTSLNFSITETFVEEQFKTNILPGISEFIRIDNLSPNYDPEWNTNGKQEKAAQFLLNWALSQGVRGIKGEMIKAKERTPIIFFEVEANGSGKNIFMYGHFDKQPHFSGWAEGLGPCLPVIRGDNLYGRGGADDGYAIFSSIASIKAIQEQGKTHGRITILIEGSEESGSPDLIPYINDLKERIGTPDLVVCLDSGCLDYNTLWITTSLRGVVNVDIKIDVLEEAVHSGVGTGICPDSLMILRSLLERIEDSKTGRVHEDFHVQIPQGRIEEMKSVGEEMKEGVIKFKLKPGVKPLSDDYAEIIANNVWRPTITVTGASGFPAHKTAGNVLRASTEVRLSMRLPPTKNAKEAETQLIQKLTENPPFNAPIQVSGGHAGSGWNANVFSEKLDKCLERASQNAFGKKVMKFGEGGSIPFIKSLGDFFPQCEILVLGVLGPNSNAHSVNEALNIPYTKKITSIIAHVLNEYSN